MQLPQVITPFVARNKAASFEHTDVNVKVHILKTVPHLSCTFICPIPVHLSC